MRRLGRPTKNVNTLTGSDGSFTRGQIETMTCWPGITAPSAERSIDVEVRGLPMTRCSYTRVKNAVVYGDVVEGDHHYGEVCRAIP